MLTTLRQLSRDLICINENFGEQLFNINLGKILVPHALLGRVSSLENSRDNESNSNYPNYGRYPEYPFLKSVPCQCPTAPIPVTNRNDNSLHSHILPKPNVSIRPQSYDGIEDFEEYLAQFQVFVDLHGWDYHTKSLYLASNLTGKARTALSKLSAAQMWDLDSLVRVSSMRFGSVEPFEMYCTRLKSKVNGPNESLSEMAQSGLFIIPPRVQTSLIFWLLSISLMLSQILISISV
jgi:hypothetical protein